MGKSDYELIARCLKEAGEKYQKDDAFIHATVALANEFAKRNPRFDRAKFMVACGLVLLA